MKKQKIAKKLLKIAKMLVSVDENKIKEDIKKISESKKEWKNISKNIEIDVQALQNQIDELNKQKQILQNKRKQQFKEFDEQSGMSKTLKQASLVLVEGMKLGQNLNDLVESLNNIDEEIVIRADKSKQPSYKEAWELLVSTLNGTEYQKYVERIQSSFKKNVIEVKTGIDLLKTSVKSWDKDYEEFYNERKQIWDSKNPDNPMPKLVKAGIRTAGFKDMFIGFGKWIKEKYNKLINFFTKSGKEYFSLEQDLSKANKYVSEILGLSKRFN